MSTQSVRVREFSLPGGNLGRGTLLCGICMALSISSKVIAPGSPIYDFLLAGRPNALKYAIWAQNAMFYFLFGTHSVECVIFAATKLRKHGVPFLSLLWGKWMLAILVGGQFVWGHFDNVVKATAAKGA